MVEVYACGLGNRHEAYCYCTVMELDEFLLTQPQPLCIEM